MNSFEQLITISADSVESLRRIDVFRVLSAASETSQLNEMINYIIKNRPDLIDECEECKKEIER